MTINNITGFLTRFLGVMAFIMLLPSCGYNKIVEYEEAVNGQWGQVEAAYQRRADLIPNLLRQAQAVEGFNPGVTSKLEKAYKVLSDVKLDTDGLSEKEIANYQTAQNDIENAMGSFVQELSKVDANAYGNFQAQIEGTENRIRNERKKYNDKVTEYNSYIKKAPQSFSSGCMGFDTKPHFKAERGAG